MNTKSKLVLAVAALSLALAVWGMHERKKETATEQKADTPAGESSQLSTEDGKIVITLDREAQERAGIQIVPLQSAIWNREILAYGTVLPPGALIDLRNNFVAIRAQLQRTRAALQASGREYERLKTLHADDRNVSDKVLQAAEAAWRSDDAATGTAQGAFTALEQNARQSWGGALAQAVQEGSPLFERLAQQKAKLLRITVPAGVSIAQAPRAVRLQAHDGKLESADLISASPQTDPRLQGVSYFYSASGSGLLPGMTLTAFLPSGREMQGAMVPADAAVWWQGRMWLYAERTGNKFVRREFSTDNPAPHGWFVGKAFVGTQVVVKGAQLLLSEELRPQTKSDD